MPELTGFELPNDDRPKTYPIHMIAAMLPRAEGDRAPTSTAEPDRAAETSVPPVGAGVGGLTPVSALIAAVQAGQGGWHNATLRLVAHWVGVGWSDREILLTAPALTLTGYTVAQTETELLVMIGGARRRWNQPDPAPLAVDPDNAFATPLDLFAEYDTSPPVLQPEYIPNALWGWVSDTAERMGADPAAAAVCSLVACAAVISDDWRVQPKALDTTWTENARLWGAIVGDPSILKTPLIAAATRPIDVLDSNARKAHSEAMAEHRRVLKEAKAADGNAKDAVDKVLKPPRLPRYLIENTTIEALTEVLRDDEDAIVSDRREMTSALVVHLDAGGRDRWVWRSTPAANPRLSWLACSPETRAGSSVLGGAGRPASAEAKDSVRCPPASGTGLLLGGADPTQAKPSKMGSHNA